MDWYYIDALEHSINNKPPNNEAENFFEPAEPFEISAKLQQVQHEADKRLIQFTKLLTDAIIAHPVAIPRHNGIHTEQISRLLAHLFQHQIHHRGRYMQCLLEHK